MKTYENQFVLVIVIAAFFFGCNESKDIFPKPEITIESSKVPIGDCPDGFEWDPLIRECIPEENPAPTKARDINPATITWNTNLSYFTDEIIENGVSRKWKMTPGNTINKISYTKAQIYLNGVTTPKDLLILGFQNIGNTTLTDYHIADGNLIGRLETNNNIFVKFNPGWSGPIGGADFHAQFDFAYKWGHCVAVILNAFTSGDPVMSLTGLLCIAFGPECAAAIIAACIAIALLI